MPRRACRILSRSICHLYLTTTTTTTHVSLPPAVEAVAQNGGQDGDDSSVGLTQQHTHIIMLGFNIRRQTYTKQNILVLDIYQVIKKGKEMMVPFSSHY